MRALCLIPVRMGSARFPGKPLAKILGRPMVEWAYLAAKEAELLAGAYVTSPDLEIAELCKARKIPHIVSARECQSGTERCQNALRQLAARDPEEIIINLQGDEPAIRPESLDALVRAFEDPQVEIASLFRRGPVGEAGSDRNRVKVILMKSLDAFAFTREPVHPAVTHGLHVGVYAYRREVLAELVKIPGGGTLEQTPWLQAGRRIRMVPIDYETAAVDTPEDLPLAEAALEAGMRP